MLDDLDLLAGVERLAVRRSRACQSSPRTATSPSRPDLAVRRRRACACPTAAGRRRTCTTFVEHEHEERARTCAAIASGDAQRDLVAGSGRLEEEQRAEDEAGGARQRERAVAEGDEQLGDPERERGGDQDQARPVDRAARRARRTRSRGRGSRTSPGRSGPGARARRRSRARRARASARSGSGRSACRAGASRGPSSPSSPRRPSVCRTKPFGIVLRPSILFSSAGRLGATTSITFCRSAVAGREVRGHAHGLRPPRSTFRPWVCASATSDAAASLTILRRRSLWMFVAAEVDRRRRADVRLRRHRQDVGRLADPDAGRGGPRPVGRRRRRSPGSSRRARP